MKWTDSPAAMDTSAGSNTRLPLAPIITSTAHAGVARKSVDRSAKKNFI
ncbi:hypothetical protein [Acinetobacter baumannii]|nr:hypothetical protein [Acinetobacter baumannii]